MARGNTRIGLGIKSPGAAADKKVTASSPIKTKLKKELKPLKLDTKKRK